MAQVAYEAGRFTYADYCAWPEEERWELIEGVAYAMSPAPARVHQDVVVELARQIGNHLQDGPRDNPCRVYVAPFDVRLPDYDEADELVETVVQPDIAVICDPSRLDDKGCRGAPDWIIEVLSPTTAARDRIHKRALYERHGVREYWLVHPTDRLLFVYRLAPTGRMEGPYISAATGHSATAALRGLAIDWHRGFPIREATN